MKTVLITVGKAKAPFLEADAHYLKMLSRRMPVDLIQVGDEEKLVSRIPDRCHLVALDSTGDQLDSLAWATWIQQRRLEALDLCFLIGGPKGLSAKTLERADRRISLGSHTIAHQLARVVLLEQLFRADKILAGETYHY